MAHSINYNISGTNMEIEMNRKMMDLVAFLDDYWTLSIFAAVVYVIAVFGGRRVMDSYARLSLTYSLVTWNGMLAIFSILGTIRMLPNLHYALTQQSFHESVCSAEWTEVPVVRVWTTLFSLSKIVELGDTAFIVLRKQPLMLLHWYHHITVLIYTWYSYADRTSSGRWYIAMNYAVHSTMYTYYAFRALKYRPPEWLKMFITIFQLSQMVVGVYIAVYVYKLKQANIACGVTDNNMKLSFIMYFSYFLLFAKFFYEAYIKTAPKKSTKSNGTSVYSNGHHTAKKSGTSNGHAMNGSTANGRTQNGHIGNGLTKGKKVD